MGAAQRREAVAVSTVTLVGMGEDRPKINVYTCDDCGHEHVTVDVDEGTTPMFMRCKNRLSGGRGCGGRAVSAMYRVDQSLTPGWEWYRPKRTAGLTPAAREHVRLGGLVLRRKREAG